MFDTLLEARMVQRDSVLSRGITACGRRGRDNQEKLGGAINVALSWPGARQASTKYTSRNQLHCARYMNGFAT